MRVLVVGGTGNISTSIVEQLVAAGHDTAIVTRGIRPDGAPPEVERIVADRSDSAAFEARMVDERFDAVIDMIAFTPAHAESAVRAFGGRTAHYVVCSTVMTYGTTFTTVPTTEDEPQTAVDVYGSNK